MLWRFFEHQVPCKFIFLSLKHGEEKSSMTIKHLYQSHRTTSRSVFKTSLRLSESPRSGIHTLVCKMLLNWHVCVFTIICTHPPPPSSCSLSSVMQDNNRYEQLARASHPTTACHSGNSTTCTFSYIMRTYSHVNMYTVEPGLPTRGTFCTSETAQQKLLLQTGHSRHNFYSRWCATELNTRIHSRTPRAH